MIYYLHVCEEYKFSNGHKNVPEDPDPAGSIINWPPDPNGNSELRIRGSGSERKIKDPNTAANLPI